MKQKNLFDFVSDNSNSFYVFYPDILIKNIKKIKSAFKSRGISINIGYSFKTNYTPKICSFAKEQGCWAEVVSSMEYKLAKKLSFNSKIILNGPVKDLETIVDVGQNGGIIHVDNYEEFLLVEKLASACKCKFKTVVRLNFVKGELKFSRFGIYQQSLIEKIIEHCLKSSSIEFLGFHIHYPNRSLNSFITRVELMYDIVKKYHNLVSIKYISIGGGFFSEPDKFLKSMFSKNVPSFKNYVDEISPWFKKIKIIAKDVSFFIEPGTALVANTMEFYSKIYSIKKIHGKGVATLWSSIFNITGNARGVDFPFEISKHPGSVYREDVDIFSGYTCIESDIFNKSVKKKLSIHDVVVFKNVGSYSNVFKPPFILPNCPMMLVNNKECFIIKREETFDDVFNTYIF